MKRILIVEDDDTLREMYGIKFEMAGFEVVTAPDGVSGLKHAVSERFDLLMLDNLMPKLSGLRLLEEYRAASVEQPAKVIFLSNKSSLPEINRSKELGALAYLIKSQYTPDQILKQIQTILA